jgi:hypothetical protein
MGCPPDPVEVGIYNSNQDRLKAEAKLAELGIQKENSLKLLEQLKPLLSEDQKCLSLINDITQAIVEPEEQLTEISKDPTDQYQDAHEATRELLHAERKLKNRENSLCIIRDGLLKLSAYIKTEALPVEITTALDGERGLHQEHREDDRKIWLAWLNQKMGVFKYHVKKAETQKKDSELPLLLNEGVLKLEKEISRVQGFSSEELLLTRNLFGNNEEEFGMPLSVMKRILF